MIFFNKKIQSHGGQCNWVELKTNEPRVKEGSDSVLL